MKKWLRLLSLTCTLVMLSTSAFAQNIQLSRDFINKWQKGLTTISGQANFTTEKTTYDDNEIYCSIRPFFAFQPVYGGVKNQDGIIYANFNSLLVHETGQLVVTGFELTIVNKTDSVLSIDLNKSLISIGSYKGRPIPEGTKFDEQQSAVLPPLIVPPLDKVSKNIYRGDFRFINSGRARWECPNDLKINQNLFDSGSFVFSEESPTKKYIPMNFYMEFTEESLADSNTLTYQYVFVL